MKKVLTLLIVALLAAGAYFGFDFYKKIFAPNVLPEKIYLNIPTGSTFNDVLNILKENKILKDEKSFSWVAEKMKYKNRILPGRYHIEPGMSNKDLVTLLRSGKQTPVNLVFNSIRTKQELAGIISRAIEADSVSIMNLLNDSAYLKNFGLKKESCAVFFIPNTYEFYWNTTAKQFMERMAKEYKKFWTYARKAKTKTIGLTPEEISVMASIVEQETHRDDEKTLIAGVYMNRLKKGWKLEADPTLIFSLGDFTVNRVLNQYKEINSPYNTYMYLGLPPGPICIPSISSIDAVLNYSKHDYLFFCARDDFSGYHSFAKTYIEHLLNAKRFQKELNRRNIRS